VPGHAIVGLGQCVLGPGWSGTHSWTCISGGRRSRRACCPAAAARSLVMSPLVGGAPRPRQSRWAEHHPPVDVLSSRRDLRQVILMLTNFHLLQFRGTGTACLTDTFLLVVTVFVSSPTGERLRTCSERFRRWLAPQSSQAGGQAQMQREIWVARTQGRSQKEDIGGANKTIVYSSVRNNNNYKYQINRMYIVSKILVILHSHNLNSAKQIVKRTHMFYLSATLRV
jgi:hypothetical protein